MKSAARNLVFGVAAVVLAFLIIEVALRLVVNLSFDYLARKDDINYEYKLWQMHLFDSFMGMQEPDAELFWKLKPGYRSSFVQVNRQGFAGPDIQPKRSREFRILFIGDSTPLGLGLAKSSDSFVWLVQDLLQSEVTDRKVVVINGSVAGFTSWQCRRLLELRGEELQPDLVITYCGNNDPSYNGYLSDRQLSELAGRRSWLNDLLGKSYGYELLKEAMLKLRDAAPATSELQPRVSVQEYRENLRAVKAACDRIGCQLAICSIPTPYLWPPGIQFKVFASGKDSAGRLVMADSLRQGLNSQWDLCLDTLLLPGISDLWAKRVYSEAESDSDSPATRERELRRELSRFPHDPRLLNNLATAIWRQGRDSVDCLQAALLADSLNPVPWYNLGVLLYRKDYAAAIKYLDRARDLDNYSLRIKSTYNRALRGLCVDAAVPLIDLETIFRDLPENKYYVDHCHPTAAGHELIARRIATAVSTMIAQRSAVAPESR